MSEKVKPSCQLRLKKMEKETRPVDGHYEVAMLCDYAAKPLPDNLPMALTLLEVGGQFDISCLETDLDRI